MDNIERAIISPIVSRAIAKGYSLTVLADGERPAEISKSRNATEVMKAMAAASYDILSIDGAGWVQFVYGNGEDVVSDYTDNAAIREIVGD